MSITGGPAAGLDRSQARLARPPAPPADFAALTRPYWPRPAAASPAALWIWA
jgi:hypothetical protein